jgi:hypothetical protein
MAKSTNTKWLIGLTGTALSAFVISQIGANQPSSQALSPQETMITNSMSKQEKELVQLDWSNFTINGVVISEGVAQSDRQTRRS